MWTAVELRDLALVSLALRTQLEAHRAISAVGSLLTALDGLDEEPIVAGMLADLERSFASYARRGSELAAIVWTWAGAEVEPYVPTDVWGNGYGAYEDTESSEANELTVRELAFSASGGFGFAPLDEWLVDLAARPALEAIGVQQPATKLVVARTLELAARALRRSVETAAFRALPRRTPFAFFARPGHDEPVVRLLSC